MTDAARNPVSTTRSFGMPAKVAPDGTVFHYRESLAAPVREGPPSEDEELGALWGCTAKAAHQLKLHAARRAADVIRYRRAIGEHERACTYAAPVEEAMAGLSCGDAAKREEIADAQEDVAQGMYRAEPSKQALQALLRARANMRQSSIDHDRELIAAAPKEWGIQP
jgi:hypothetical protein